MKTPFEPESETSLRWRRGRGEGRVKRKEGEEGGKLSKIKCCTM